MKELGIRGSDKKNWSELSEKNQEEISRYMFNDHPTDEEKRRRSDDHEIKKAVFSSPMIDLLYPGMPRSLGRLLIKTMSVFGFSERYAPGNMDYGSLQRSAVGMALLTSDPERFQDEHFLIDRNPDLALGGVTYGWLQAAQRSIDLLASPGYAEGLSMPILIVQAGSDRLIDKARVALFAHRLPNGQLEFIEEARHEILKERDSIRDQFWTHFDKFMNAN